jgi:murein DD-endopeptidase MepM/ murein hydrolase activator NlpD
VPTVFVSPVPSATPAAPPTERAPKNQPIGFPVDPETRLGVVEGTTGSRQLVFDGAGPTAREYAANGQLSPDPDSANRSGWNCRTHVEYEGQAALDFYIPGGTPILATMDGTATLYARSYVNDFDRYSVGREPYLGNPDRTRAPYSPFPGPSSGVGISVTVQNSEYVTEYGHLDLAKTVGIVPSSAFLDGYSPDSAYMTLFEAPASSPAAIASWSVQAGDVIGLSGDAAYSEGPHLHYTIQRAGQDIKLCPTTESGFFDSGWLFR